MMKNSNWNWGEHELCLELDLVRQYEHQELQMNAINISCRNCCANMMSWN